MLKRQREKIMGRTRKKSLKRMMKEGNTRKERISLTWGVEILNCYLLHVLLF
jgi:hypothetical protein